MKQLINRYNISPSPSSTSLNSTNRPTRPAPPPPRRSITNTENNNAASNGNQQTDNNVEVI